jgi:hypothetical protein
MSEVNPPVFSFIKSSRGHQNVQMRMKVQSPSEGVRDDQDNGGYPVVRFDPAPNDGSGKSSDIAQKSPIFLKMPPELFRHREADL